MLCKDVCRRDKHDVGQIKRNLHEMIAERIILLRIKYLKQG